MNRTKKSANLPRSTLPVAETNSYPVLGIFPVTNAALLSFFFLTLVNSFELVSSKLFFHRAHSHLKAMATALKFVVVVIVVFCFKFTF